MLEPSDAYDEMREQHAREFGPQPTLTPRGFEVVHFRDRNGQECTIQQSSAIGNHEDAIDRPGSSFVWLGVGEHRMHLSRRDVADLFTYLERWMECGSFRDQR